MNPKLPQFTRNALGKGASRNQFAAALKAADWRETDVRAAAGKDEAMRPRHRAGRACFASTVTPKPPPQPGARPALTRSAG